jgi:hypothetical protein
MRKRLYKSLRENSVKQSYNKNMDLVQPLKKLTLIAGVFLVFVASSLVAEGSYENPSQIIVKTFTAPVPKILEIRGKIHFTLKQGSRYEVVMKTNRAVMGQVGVYTLFGFGTIAVESGLQGPREHGEAWAKITVPSLQALRILGESEGSIDWPGGTTADLTVSETSKVTLHYSGSQLVLVNDWHSECSVVGKISKVEITSRNQAKTDLTQAHIETLWLDLKDLATVTTSDVQEWGGTVRLGARALWQPLAPSDRKPKGNLSSLPPS